MGIRFRCRKCRATVTAPDAYAGQHAKCPKCYGQISVPPGIVQPAGIPPAPMAPLVGCNYYPRIYLCAPRAGDDYCRRKKLKKPRGLGN